MNQLEQPFDWHLTQDEDYIRLCLDRLNQEPLKWVTQVVALIEQHGRRRDHSDRSMSVNDVGCNVGHLPKGLSEAGLSCDYLGLDVSETYLRHAREAFPGHAFALHDISSSAPREADISVCSAVLEHILRWEDALENVLQSTRSTAYVRTFFGPQYERSAYVKGQSVPYWIQQFSIVQFGELCSQRGFTMRIVRDSATDSMPQYVGCGVTRTFFLAEHRFSRCANRHAGITRGGVVTRAGGRVRPPGSWAASSGVCSTGRCAGWGCARAAGT